MVQTSVSSSHNDLSRAAEIIQHGGVVGMPTETVYGLAADATNAEAVAQIFAVKRRPYFDPLIVHVANLEQAERWAEFDDVSRQLARALWPGPLTLVLPRRRLPVGEDGQEIADLVSSGLDTVALRAPDHPLAQAVIRLSDRPLAAPSANRFGALSPTTADAVIAQLGDDVPLVLDGGPARVGLESTVLRTQPEPLVLRPGGISVEQLRDLLPGVPIALSASPAADAGLALEAPGMLASHYAPNVPLVLREGDWPVAADIARLAFALRSPDQPHQADPILPSGGPTEVLSGDMLSAAAGLFAALRRLQDAPGVRRIVTELVPDHGLGRAINDRLRRAAGLG